MPINTKVFLDANIVIRTGKPPGGPEFERIVDLVDAEIISILSTDLTIAEVAKKHTDNDYKVVKEIGRPHFRKLVEEIVGANIPDITKTALREKIRANYSYTVAEMFEMLDAQILSIDDIKPSVVFNNYATGSGFFTDEGKKDQFPDAFIFECLNMVASEKSPVIIVSDDGDFMKSANAHDNITLLKSLPALFTFLGFEMKAPLIEDFLKNNSEELMAFVNQELLDWGLIGDVQSSEIDDTEVIEVILNRLTAFKPVEEGDALLVVGQINAKVNVSYSHPDWDTAMYDSEDKVHIPFESVDGELELDLEIDISLSIAVDEDGKPEEIEMLSFRNSNFQYVELHPYDPYDYK